MGHCPEAVLWNLFIQTCSIPSQCILYQLTNSIKFKAKGSIALYAMHALTEQYLMRACE